MTETELFIKSVVINFLFPLPLAMILFLAGLLLLWFQRLPRAALGLLTVSFLVLFVSTTEPMVTTLIRTLENRYRAVLDPSKLGRIDTVVVLGAIYTDNPEISTVSRISPILLQRSLDGFLLHKKIPGSKMILSGRGEHEVTEAEMMFKFLSELGLEEKNVILHKTARRTSEEAEQVRSLVGDRPFILVTSAIHMPRAMALFRKLGMNPIAAPTDHLLKGQSHELSAWGFLPNSTWIKHLDVTLYEYLGWLKEILKGKA